MIQPFKPEHIRRYLLLYAGIVVLMILFYLINTFLNPPTTHERKIFNTERNATDEAKTDKNEPNKENPFRLLPPQ